MQRCVTNLKKYPFVYKPSQVAKKLGGFEVYGNLNVQGSPVKIVNILLYVSD